MELLSVFLRSAVIFFIVPLMLGRITARDKRATYRYAFGFVAMTAGFYAIYLFTYYTHHSVHVMHFLFVAAVCAIALVWLLLFARHLRPVRFIKGVAAGIAAHPVWIVFIVIVILQAYRMIAYTQINYSDDDTYIPMVADMIASDKFYAIYGPDGSFVSSAYDIPKKYTLSGWMAFEAELSMFTGTHPLVLVKTIFPIAEIFLHYCIMLELAGLFLRKRDDKAVFAIIYALILEVGWTATTTTLSYYFLTWLWYGKAFAQFIIIPFILTVWLSDEMKTPARLFALFVVSAAGAAASMMGVVLVVTEVAFLTLASLIRYRSLRPVIAGGAAMLPQVAVAAIYLFM